MQKERLHWIDIAKGIGIILVIYGHALGSDSIRHILYAFHMPLFFFVSGILFHHKKYEHFRTFLKKNIKGILIPYFIFAFINLLLWYYGNERTIPNSELQNHVYGIFIGSSREGYLGFNVALWFLPCLFVTRIGFWLITAISEKIPHILSFLFLFSVLGFGLSKFFPHLLLPFGAEAAVTGIVFFGLGYLWNSNPKDLQTFFNKHAKIIMIIAFFMCIVIAQITYEIYGFQIDMRFNRLNNYPLFYFGALSGTCGVLALSYTIGRNRILEYLGRYSLILFVWHPVIFSYLTRILRIFPLFEIPRGVRSIFMPFFYTAISIVIILKAASTLKKMHLKFFTVK